MAASGTHRRTNYTHYQANLGADPSAHQVPHYLSDLAHRGEQAAGRQATGSLPTAHRAMT